MCTLCASDETEKQPASARPADAPPGMILYVETSTAVVPDSRLISAAASSARAR